MAVASLVLGIIGLVFSINGTFVAFFGALLGILAIIFASIELKNNTSHKGMCRAGLITGIIAGVLGILITAACWACVAGISNVNWNFHGFDGFDGFEDFFNGIQDFFEDGSADIPKRICPSAAVYGPGP